MRIALAAAVLATMCLGAIPVWAAEAAGGEAAPEDRVSVVGEVKWRAELETVSGVKAWVINGQEIPIEQLRDRAVLFYGTSVLQDMVAEALMQQEAKRRGLVLTEQEVQDTEKALREELGLRSAESFDNFLRVQHATSDWFSSKARSYALLVKVLSDQVYVSDREVEATYNRNQAAYRRAESVAFRVMRFTDKPSAEAALASVRAGKSFEDVARERALTPQERAVAGELQFYERGQQTVPPQFETALLAAPLNQIAGPVEVLGSFYLLRIERKLDPHQFTLDEVREAIRDQLRKQKLEQLVWPTWIADQLKSAKIEVRPAS
jgi:foldase protein PrsA